MEEGNDSAAKRLLRALLEAREEHLNAVEADAREFAFHKYDEALRAFREFILKDRKS
jgi:hypothetical protein